MTARFNCRIARAMCAVVALKQAIHAVFALKHVERVGIILFNLMNT